MPKLIFEISLISKAYYRCQIIVIQIVQGKIDEYGQDKGLEKFFQRKLRPSVGWGYSLLCKGQDKLMTKLSTFIQAVLILTTLLFLLLIC